MVVLIGAGAIIVGMTDPIEDTASSRPWTRRSATVWAAARADYLAGGSAAEVCERHGLSLSTFRWRARTEGWRLADQPHGAVVEPQEADDLAFADAHPPCNAAEMARLAWSNASRAMRDGKLIEARGWSRLHVDLEKMARDDRQRLRTYAKWAEHPANAGFIPTTPPYRPMEED
ncbi:hypothetical protein [Brevundimonas sp. SORGH_AS_0993]|uniref:hypothetical protein n=1 Tax=Brevundimonas sp. SORGH_AS_0993 TaxID=3041794 RepID=UPI0027835A77|nr:hypothetical protein [Brevundimonas sp. SORGH_AS_0993]MDQ1153925.1 hypothetical protein [Brevundimonas sp. SORGH_AS_0993]